ncbi:low temperature requirement protein A [Pimelobacter simplex]|uniref:low temperature requirement protein A n=1 Tax=Nocardioides simplex TaxID=2045 RepID=UPI00214FEA0C|nr:low temperature requirement protein A [Pimelobacter simplex]UUW91305.1 low temperature requirement protein A [Pimelobacter simplex]UUW95133.1 low temperature requirement protein A [Pimelobacter simplex]
MSEQTAVPNVRHRTRRMLGRDPHEGHRAATPLELLFDLTFVVAFGTAANELAHAVAEEHVWAGILGFCFATFGVSWAWINFTWFASAYDTDDWIYRLTTMLQMIGVLVFAIGLKPMFTSIYEHGETLDNDVMVWGYVVMRVAMVLQWWRAGRHDAARRPACQAYIVSILVAQVFWCALALVDLPVGTTFALMVIPFLIEIGGPAYAETRRGGTPWHAHHIAERYSLMVIIALGEGMIGTMAAISELSTDGLTWDIAWLALAGISLTFGIWWSYFVIPFADILHAHRERSFSFGYGHMPLFGSIVAVGAGLHVGAYYLSHEYHIGLVGSVLSVAIPVALFTVFLYAGYTVQTRSFDSLHVVLLAISAALVVGSVLLAAAGVALVWCLLVVALTPWVTVVGYELRGYRHNLRVLGSLDG